MRISRRKVRISACLRSMLVLLNHIVNVDLKQIKKDYKYTLELEDDL